MYLYKNNKDKSISIYRFVPNRTQLIEFKKKYLEDIRSVRLHINNKKTEELLFSSQSSIMFSALDRKEDNGRISYIEETNNNKVISNYINGVFDSVDPINIVGNKPLHKSYYCGTLNNQDSLLLVGGGSYPDQSEFRSDESVLLTGWLDMFQPLLSNSISNVLYPENFGDSDKEIEEFLRLFSCEKKSTISLKDLRLLKDEGLINFNDDFYDSTEKSEIVLNNYRRVLKK